MQSNTLIIHLGQGLVYAVITFAFIVLAKRLEDFRTTAIDDDDEILEKSNAALGFRRTGLYLAYAIAFAGTLSGENTGLSRDIIALLADGVVITACLFACRSLNDRVMLAHMDNDQAIRQGNIAVGISECGMYIATGFVLNGSFTGGSEGIFQGLVSAIVFFLIGQAALLLCGYCYERMTPFSIREEVRKGNAAAGIALAGILVALGVILKGSIAGPAGGWSADLISFGIYTVYGILLLLLFKKAIDVFLLPGTTLAAELARDQNVAALALTEAAIIAVAVVISSVM